MRCVAAELHLCAETCFEQVYDKMDRRFFRELGTNAELKEMVLASQRFHSVLKFDSQLVLLLLYTALFFTAEDKYTGGGAASCAA